MKYYRTRGRKGASVAVFSYNNGADYGLISL